MMNKSLVLLTGILLNLTSVGALTSHADSEASQAPLIQRLPGYWQGEALETPVGRMDYDMVFHVCDDGAIAGVAATGASLHYWRFTSVTDHPDISFLSTFRGNRTPQPLSLEKVDGSTLSFYAPNLKLLTLEATLLKSSIDFRVFHHGKPHVHIRLSRVDKEVFSPAPHHSRRNSCRGAPAEPAD